MSLSEIGTLDNCEIVEQINTVDGIAGEVNALLSAVYADDSLADQRRLLHQSTQAGAEELLPEATDESILLVWKIRRAILAASASDIKAPTVAIGDGDLAYTTYGWRGTHASHPAIMGDADQSQYFRSMLFSPELQLQIASTDVFSGAAIFLAQNQALSAEAQVSLFNHEHFNVRNTLLSNSSAKSEELFDEIFWGNEGLSKVELQYLYSDRVHSPRQLMVIASNPLWKLVLDSKTDAEGELALLASPVVVNEPIICRIIAARSPLHTPEALRKLHSLSPESIIYNKNLKKHPDLVENLDINAFTS